MLDQTFIHISGIGPKTERQLWAAGIHCRADFLDSCPAAFPARAANLIRTHLNRHPEEIFAEPRQIAEQLAAGHHWRLFPHFRSSTAYLDIETNGLDRDHGEITSIALYDGTAINCFVQGENLDAFPAILEQYQVIVTYNGKTFDIPFIENYFGIAVTQVHLDLRYILNNLGYSGGLKKCEQRLGMDRGELTGVDGYFAVLLWREYQRTGNRAALETLLAYNILDTISLETLMVHAYNQSIADTPFAASHRLELPTAPPSPFQPDPRLVAALRQRYYP